MALRQCVAGILVVGVAACASLPNQFATLDVEKDIDLPLEFASPTEGMDRDQNSKIVGGLLSLFDDPRLDDVVFQALQGNFDIRLAGSRLEEAGYTSRAEWGNLLPSVVGNVNTVRNRDAMGNISNSISPSLDVSWEVDVWGGLRAQKDQKETDAAVLESRLAAAKDSVVAQTIQAWFAAVVAEQQLQLTQVKLENLSKIAANNRLQYRAGLVTRDDLTVVERDIARAEVSLSESIETRNDRMRGLQILLGAYPSADIILEFDLPDLLAPPKPGVPADVLANRPDLQAAWLEVVSADHAVNIAHKAQFPNFKLTASLGNQSTAFSEFLSGATIWSLASNISYPLFNVGQLRNNLNAAESRAEQAWISYLSNTLRAFQEVEQALDRETLLADREVQQQLAVQLAEEAATIFRARYQNGLVSILEVLQAENDFFDLKGELLGIRKDRLNNRVALALALGAGV